MVTTPNAHSPSVASPNGLFPVGGEPEAERVLSEEVEKLLAKLGSTLHALGGGGSGSKDQAAQLFLQANGIAMGSPTYGTAAAAGGRVGGSGLPQGFAEALRADLLQARTLIRQLDSERRHHRKQAHRQQRELSSTQQIAQAAQREATEGNRRVRALEAQLAAAKDSVRAAEDEVDALTMDVMRLRRFVRALPPAFADGLATMEEEPARAPEVASVLGLVPDRRFSEAFRDKMTSIVYKRRFHAAKALHQEAAEKLAALAMEQEDAWEHQSPSYIPHSTVGAAAAVVGHPTAVAVSGIGGELQRSSSSGPSTSVAALLGDASRRGFFDFPFQLPFTPVTPKDEYIKSLIYNSQFAEPLHQGRDNLLRLSTRLKSSLDAGLKALYGILLDTICSSTVADNTKYNRRAFETQLQKLESVQREMLFSLVSTTNSTVIGVIEAERGKRSSGQGSGRGGVGTHTKQTRDVGTMAIDTSTSDYHIHLMEDKLSQLRLRALEAEGECSKRLEQAAEETKEARWRALHILGQLESLGKAAADAARSAQKRGGSRGQDDGSSLSFPDPFAPLRASVQTEVDLDDPRLTVKVTEATELATSYVRQLSLLRPGSGSTPFVSATEALARVEELASASTAPSPPEGHATEEPPLPRPEQPLPATRASRAPRKLSADTGGKVTAHSASSRRRNTLPLLNRKPSPHQSRTSSSRRSSQRTYFQRSPHHPHTQQQQQPPTPNAPAAADEGKTVHDLMPANDKDHKTANMSVIQLSFPR